MTSRLYIIRGTFILFWFFYDLIGNLLNNTNFEIELNFLVLFGLLSLFFGLFLHFSKENYYKFSLCLLFSIVGLLTGLKGLNISYISAEKFSSGGVSYFFSTIISLFFGILIVFLYVKSLREILKELLKYRN